MEFWYFMRLGKFRHNTFSLHYWNFNIFWDLKISCKVHKWFVMNTTQIIFENFIICPECWTDVNKKGFWTKLMISASYFPERMKIISKFWNSHKIFKFCVIAPWALRSVWANVCMRVWIIKFFLFFSSFFGFFKFFGLWLPPAKERSGTPVVATKSW